jgi:hypothetical protein
VEAVIEANLHAISLLVLLVGSIALLALFPKIPYRPVSVLLLLGLAMSLCALGISVSRDTRCSHTWLAVFQWCAPAFAMFTLCLLRVSRTTRVTGCVLLMITGVFLYGHYYIIAHRDGFSGNPDSDAKELAEFDPQWALSTPLRHFRSRSRWDSSPYSAGWADEVFAGIDFDSTEIDDLREPHPLWHTWLTGVSGVRAKRFRLWYPGGTVSEALPNITYREDSARNALLRKTASPDAEF